MPTTTDESWRFTDLRGFDPESFPTNGAAAPSPAPGLLDIDVAAIAHAGHSNKDPMSTFGHSLRTLENSLDWARDGSERFIYFSSSMVYGDFRKPTVTEEEPCEPLGIYGAHADSEAAAQPRP